MDYIDEIYKAIGENDSIQDVVDWLPTGVLTLNEAISGSYAGGFPVGRITEILGGESSGKCYSANNYLQVANGFYKVSEFYEKLGYQLDSTVKTVVPSDSAYLINETGHREKIGALTFNGKQPVYKITMQNGLDVEVTPNHPLRVVNNNGAIVWKNASDITKDDWIVFKTNTLRGNHYPYDADNFVKAYVAGALMASRHTSVNTVNLISNNQALIDKLSKFFNKYHIGYKIANKTSNNMNVVNEFIIDESIELTKIYHLLKIQEQPTEEQEIPMWVRIGGIQIAIHFLRGYTDYAGSFSNRDIRITTASSEFARQLQIMLLSLGIASTRVLNKIKDDKQDTYKIIISEADYQRYLHKIGSEINEYKELINNVNCNEFNDSWIIPYQQNIINIIRNDCNITEQLKELCNYTTKFLSYNVAKRIVDYCKTNADKLQIRLSGQLCLTYLSDIIDREYFFSKVISVEQLGNVPTFDVHMPKTNTFLMNGVINHNTLLATMALIETQRKGGLAVFLDYEHAFSIRHAVNIGLDNKNNWVYRQPITAEEGFMMIEKIADIVRAKDKKTYITIVVDSVATMRTQAEMETDYDKLTMKTSLTLPSLMSTALRKIHPIVNSSNITLIFLNQTRDNIGVMFGDKKTTPGGTALKFYSSVRVQLSKIKKEKITRDKKEYVVGEVVKAIIKKNKTFEPFREATFISSFTEGIDLVKSHVLAAKELGLLGDSSKIFTFAGNEFKSETALIKFLRESPEHYQKLLNLFIEKEKKNKSIEESI